MAQIKALSSDVINAPADKIYEILIDYRDKHPQILPEKYFSDFNVVQGGV